MSAAIANTELCFALQFETNAALDEFRTKAALRHAVYFWPASLDPNQFSVEITSRNPVD